MVGDSFLLNIANGLVIGGPGMHATFRFNNNHTHDLADLGGNMYAICCCRSLCFGWCLFWLFNTHEHAMLSGTDAM